MAQVTLDLAQRNRLVALLAERVGLTPLQRETLLDEAGLTVFRTELTFDAEAATFAAQLVRELQARGTLPETGQPALVSLLRWLREEVAGHEAERAFVDDLLLPYQKVDDPFEGLQTIDRHQGTFVTTPRILYWLAWSLTVAVVIVLVLLVADTVSRVLRGTKPISALSAPPSATPSAPHLVSIPALQDKWVRYVGLGDQYVWLVVRPTRDPESTFAFVRYRPESTDFCLYQRLEGTQPCKTEADASSMPESIGSIWVEDERVYIGVNGRGVVEAQVDEDGTATFRHLPLAQSGTVYSMLRDSKGTLWVGIDDGLYRLSSEEQELAPYDLKLFCTQSTLLRDNLYVQDIAEDREAGMVWVATPIGVLRFNRDVDTAGRHCYHPASIVNCPDIGTLPRDQPWSVAVTDDRILVGMSRGIIAELDRTRLALDADRHCWTSQRLPPGGRDPESTRVYAVADGPADLLWAATESGLYYLDNRESLGTQWTFQHDTEPWTAFDIAIGRSNMELAVYIATSSGLFRIQFDDSSGG